MIGPEGNVESVGTDIFVLTDAHKILCAYRFIERRPRR
jgi:hypothetical protein